MDLRVPTEVWTQIFLLACTDTGITGRSLSQTNRYFNAASRHVKLRSVAIRGLVQAVGFVNMIEALPRKERVVENLYVSMYNTSDLSEERRSKLLDALERTSIDSIDTTVHQQYYDCFVNIPSSTSFLYAHLVLQKAMFEDISMEVDMHALFRILIAVSPSVELLSINFGEGYRPSIFFPIYFPRLSELVLQGPYDPYDCPSPLNMLKSLRRLRLTHVYTSNNDPTLAAIARAAPNLTHLRLDHSNPYSSTVCSEFKKALQRPYDGDDLHESFPESRRLPVSLRRFLIHPGDPPPREMPGTSFQHRYPSILELRRFATREPRVCLFKEYSRETAFTPFQHEESFQEWCERMSGGLAYWNEVNEELPLTIAVYLSLMTNPPE
ncbi:hypothetical protein NLJ89_g7236 [Agrocybe chaxingu]|uniref:Uncharacterized protein n=1 Tax=Agrocybe chaxingu TaxID=84603 RepID=A0A9W8MV90_9AGAR|nr:hypothetical protein NLJ89_g7236 [Agrocybe chaxingu]